MSIPKKSRSLRIISRFAGLSAQSCIWAFSLLFGLACAGQTFTTIALPNLNSDATHGGALNYAVTPSGALVYGNDAHLYAQTSFGSATIASFNTSPNVDPSFIAVLSNSLAVVGTGGGFGNTSLLTFDPANLATTYTPFASLQNYIGVTANTTSLYVAGENGSGGSNSVSYVTTGGVQQLVVDNAGTFSAGIAVDKLGNLYVANNDNDAVYKFTSAQVSNAISTHTPLTLTGLPVTTFADGVGSIAVDGRGVIYAAGFDDNFNGVINYYDPSNGATGLLNPEAAGEVNGNFPAYALQAFDVGGTDYISYVWQAGFDAGDQVVYGYAAVPEPASSGLLAAMLVFSIGAWRRFKLAQV